MLRPEELDPNLDAVLAAPQHHRILLENEHIRVLEVIIEPGVKEPFHTHVWQSIFVVYGSPRLHYFMPHAATHLFEIPSQQETGVLYLAPEGMHALKNVDDRRLYAFRIEMKTAPPVMDRPDAQGPILEAGMSGQHLFLDNSLVRVCRANRAHESSAVMPAVIISDSHKSPAVNWAPAAGHWASAAEEDVIISFKYL